MTWTRIKTTAAVLLATATLAGAGLEGVRLAHRADAATPTSAPSPPAVAAAPRRGQPPSPWVATLGNGVRLELVGVGENPSAGRLWWRPVGSPLPRRPYAKCSGLIVANDPGRVVRELAYRTVAPLGATIVWDVSPGDSAGGGYIGEPETDGGTTTALTGMAFELPDEPATMRFDVATGAWHTDLTTAGQGGVDGQIEGGRRSVGPARPADAGNGAAVEVTLSDAGLPAGVARLVALDANGDQKVAFVARSDTERSTAHHRVLRVTYRFDDLRPVDVRSLRLQSRPFDQWVEFRHVSVHAGKPTTVTVATSDDAVMPSGTAGLPGVKRRQKHPSTDTFT